MGAKVEGVALKQHSMYVSVIQHVEGTNVTGVVSGTNFCQHVCVTELGSYARGGRGVTQHVVSQSGNKESGRLLLDDVRNFETDVKTSTIIWSKTLLCELSKRRRWTWWAERL